MSPLLSKLANNIVELWYTILNYNAITSTSPDLNLEALQGSGDFEERLHALYADSVVHSRAEATTVNLACLHRVELHRLQRELVREAMAFKYEIKRGEGVERSIFSRYVQALKDNSYIKSCALNGPENDHFVISTDIPYQRALLRQSLEEIRSGSDSNSGTPTTCPPSLHEDLARLQAHPPPYQTTGWKLFGGSRTLRNRREALERFLQRVGMAVIGGAFLIAPMHVMVLHPGKVTNLITASTSVVFFGILVAAVLERMFDVLSVTAAYAAVLVVFVGTSTGVERAG